MRTLSGRVGPGYGRGTRFIWRMSDLYEEILGVRLFPGTLNVYLDEEYPMPEDALAVGAGLGAFLVPCWIGDRSAFICRPFPMEFGYGPHDRTVIELVADVKLRDHLGLADDDVVEVRVER